MNFNKLLLLVLIIAIVVVVKAQSSNRECSTLSCPVTEGSGSGPAIVPSQNYKLTVSKGLTASGDVIKVKLQFSRCIGYDLNPYGPSWYKIEATTKDTEEAVGEFISPSKHGEAELCLNNVIVFQTCTATVTDLPRQYQWRLTSKTTQDVCFSATILHHGSSSCETLTTCIPGNDISVFTPPKIIDEEDDYINPSTPSTPSTVTPSPKRIAWCTDRWPCVAPRLNKLCGSNGVTYESRCHMRRDECIYEIDISVTKGACPVTTVPPTSPTTIPTTMPTTPPIPSYGTCSLLSKLEPNSRWKRQCNCMGDFKLTQCLRTLSGQLQCWCVTYDNGIQRGPKTPISDCESPDTYNLGCVLQ